MLSKKMYPQNCSRASSVKKILEDRPTPKMIKGKEEEEEKRKKTSDGSKWVKTDSDCEFYSKAHSHNQTYLQN